LCSALLATAFATGAAAADDVAAPGDDVTVVAVIDSTFSPYHYNYLASRTPQALDADPSNDLPLDQAPDSWVPGFPSPETFASYTRLGITLPTKSSDRVATLKATDQALWDGVQTSGADAVHYSWIPGTKVIGALDFGGSNIAGTNTDHGAGTASVSVGNIHGTCPECLLVYLSYSGGTPQQRARNGEAAINWAMSQPWIDAITNSYGFSATTETRDRLYSGSDTAAQRSASDRGQTVFFSAGNGQENAFLVPNTTYFSSQEGPDWIVTVGAISPSGGNYTGAGKPADIAALGTAYPSAGGTTVSSSGTFGGTSNATPVTAGLYARALHWARQRLDGPSRVQDAGVIARGAPIACGSVGSDCELGDGVLTAAELRTRLFHGAVRTPQGLSPAGVVNAPAASEELELLAEGHGSYIARLRNDGTWEAEQARITGPMDGTGALTPRPAGEREWMVVDSYCRQSVWGGWTGGYWQAGAPLPAPDPAWPLRSALVASCGELFPPL
ncbi:MAG: hypothetical protein M3O86_03630, partial [Actinomycetota bacterium]|nr:hypothetical protein [Actinomycetota bacterium]